MGFDLMRLLGCCCGGRPAVAEDVPEEIALDAFVLLQGGKKHADDVPAAVKKQYSKVYPHAVTVEGQGVCITSDVAVLGDVTITAAGTCITGNVLVVGDCTIDGKDDRTINGLCITGHAIILGNVKVRGNVCVEGDAFVKGDIQVQGTLKVGGKLCHWGFKDVQPLHSSEPQL
ncbi:hypothetical protein Rsub_04320 [Raphidocelis subcapitata]|uniref:Polymer-forming cytoskeletal protein n=1 Tax=Raphidocelis subcapitata TaxID=307507 RepID=A0A2V0P169_9CHLO|nr:hypothetical protein Rsub_04320 [Raphidocelis subcapitata]|eukprot:GBF91580.1 hypothetical protein Rsub_04320 [Raphidocelis subcapitata]